MASRSKPASRSGQANGEVKPSTATPSTHLPDLEERLKDVVKRFKEAGRDAHHADSIKAHWELGQLIEALRSGKNPTAGIPTGQISSNLLAIKLGLKPTQIKMAGYIYGAYPKPSARDRVFKLRRADGLPLRISVLSRLCLPRLDGERDLLLKRACDENWSETHVKELLGSMRTSDPKPHKNGGVPKPPSCLSEALTRWNRRADETIRYADTIFHKEAITRLLEAANPKPVTTDEVKALRDRLKQVQKAIASELKALDQIIEHLEKASVGKAASVKGGSKPDPGPKSGRKKKR